MNMGFSFLQEPDLRLQQSCTVCDRDVHGQHDLGCRYGERLDLINQRATQKPNIQSCPVCYESRSIDANHREWLECSKCNTQFSSSGICSEDTDGLEQAILLDSKHSEGGYSVVIMKEKGEGKFPYEEAFQNRIEELDLLVEQALEEKKKTKN